VFKILYKYASLALTSNCFVKEIFDHCEDEEEKLLFIKISWVTPNLCVVFLGFYNLGIQERENIHDELKFIFTSKAEEHSSLTYLTYDKRLSSYLVYLPYDTPLGKEIIQQWMKPNNYHDQQIKDSKSEINLVQEHEETKAIPDFVFKPEISNMSLFNFIPYRNIRLANNFCKKWEWQKDNK
jgi:hypothetical protein